MAQAALLIVGTNPAVCQENILSWKPRDRASGFGAALAALRKSINKSSLKATVRHRARDMIWREEREPGEEIMDMDEQMDADERGRRVFCKVDPDWHLTTIAVDDENRPKLAPAHVPSGAQVDQFLHAHYYQRTFEGRRAMFETLYEGIKRMQTMSLKKQLHGGETFLLHQTAKTEL